MTYLLETAPLGRFACAMAMVLARTAEVLRAAALAAPGGILIPLLSCVHYKRQHPHPWKRESLVFLFFLCQSFLVGVFGAGGRDRGGGGGHGAPEVSRSGMALKTIEGCAHLHLQLARFDFSTVRIGGDSHLIAMLI